MSQLPFFLEDYNFNRESEKIALDMIYVSTKIRIPESKIKFQIPRVLDIRPDIDDDPNTFVNGFVDRGFDFRIAGVTGFMYRRLPLNYITQDEMIQIIPEVYPYSISDILSQINLSLHTNLTTTDILDLTYTGDDPDILLVANPDSIAWIGHLTIQVKSQNLIPIVNETDLNGFNVYVGD